MEALRDNYWHSKVCSNVPEHMTKMESMPIYGNNCTQYSVFLSVLLKHVIGVYGDGFNSNPHQRFLYRHEVLFKCVLHTRQDNPMFYLA